MAKGSKPQGEEGIKKPLSIVTSGLQGASGDKAESGSLTPTITRKITPLGSDTEITIKEYGYPGQSNYVKRFAIIPEAGAIRDLSGTSITKEKFHAVENRAFDAALKEISSSQYKTVLVDVFRREEVEKGKGKFVITKDPKTNCPETHTVCLWKKSDNTVVVIDPSNSVLTDYLPKPLEPLAKSYNVTIEIQRYVGYNDKSKDDKFYAPSLIAPVGTKDDESRDCVDIAVKIAFVINEVITSAAYISIQQSINVLSAQSDSDKYLRKDGDILKQLRDTADLMVLSSIRTLSNQGNNNDFLGTANNGTLIRALQSSDPNKREEALKLLRTNKTLDKKGPADLVVVNTLDELKELDALRSDTDSIFHKIKPGTYSASGKILLRKLKDLAELQSAVDKANQQYSELYQQFPELRNFPALKIDLRFSNEQVPELDRLADPHLDGQTALHQAAQKGDHDEVSILLGYYNKEDNQKKICWHS